jgi:hypothetical protein
MQANKGAESAGGSGIQRSSSLNAAQFNPRPQNAPGVKDSSFFQHLNLFNSFLSYI